MDIKVRNICDEAVARIDDYAKANGLSREALLRVVLSDYSAVTDRFVMSRLPEFLTQSIEAAFQKYSESTEELLTGISIMIRQQKQILSEIEGKLIRYELRNGTTYDEEIEKSDNQIEDIWEGIVDQADEEQETY